MFLLLGGKKKTFTTVLSVQVIDHTVSHSDTRTLINYKKHHTISIKGHYPQAQNIINT